MEDIVELNPKLANLTAIPATQTITLPCIGSVCSLPALNFPLPCDSVPTQCPQHCSAMGWLGIGS